MPVCDPTISLSLHSSQILWNMFWIRRRTFGFCRGLCMNTTSTYRNLYLWAGAVDGRVHMRLAQCAELVLAIESFSGFVNLDKMLQKSRQSFGSSTCSKLRIYAAISIPVTNSVGTDVNRAGPRLRSKNAYASSSHILKISKCLWTGGGRVT
jgi:hypothetical protein